MIAEQSRSRSGTVTHTFKNDHGHGHAEELCVKIEQKFFTVTLGQDCHVITQALKRFNKLAY